MKKVFMTASMIASGVVAMVFIINCIGGAKDYLAWADQYHNSFFPFLYFIVGFAPLLDDVFSFIRMRGGKMKLFIPSALIFSIGCPIVFSALKNSFMNDSTNLLLYRLAGTYSAASWLTIIFSIVAFVLLIMAKISSAAEEK